MTRRSLLIGVQYSEVVGEAWFLPGEPADVMLPRKAAKELYGCPYRKPTQVDEKNILRRTCEIFLKELGKLTP